MNKEKLQVIYNNLKTQLLDKNNSNNHEERKVKLNELNNIKIELRRIESNIRAGIIEKEIPKSNNEFNEHIDNYRYFSLLNKLNSQYIRCNCKLNIGDNVITKDGRKGYIHNIIVYPDKVTRTELGIYILINAIKVDGSLSSKSIRRTKLDDSGFPLEEISIYKG